MKNSATLLAALLFAAATPALASADLAKKSNCMACHTVDKKLVGPSYKDVAAKYAGKPDAQALLSEKIRKGGSGVWGAIQMPANAQVSDPNIQTLAKWILDGAK